MILSRALARVCLFVQAGCALVFIADGAEWIRDYLQQQYLQATHILDYFHAYERLCEFAKLALPGESDRQPWLTEHQALLYAGQVDELLRHVGALRLSESTRQARYTLRVLPQQQAAHDLRYRRRGLDDWQRPDGSGRARCCRRA
ncbi:MAG: hypothetical protein R3F53_13365 [Gammaproteobacteria bacterium]